VSGILVLTTLLIAPFRACFYRHAQLMSGPLQPGSALTLVLLGLCLFSLAMTRPQTRLLQNNAFWAVVISPELPNTIRLAVAIAVLLGLSAIWLLLRPGRVHYLPWDNSARQLLRDWGGVVDQTADGVVLGESGRAAIPFRRCDRVILGLRDPVGDEADRVSAIWRLRDLAQQEGLDAAVWQAGPHLLKVYGDLGLTALPLGADGLPLPESEIEGDQPPANQYLVCKAERDLSLLLPVLPILATGKPAAVPAAV
jgi:lysylphosphatidylglycerol synthetase-like protein (DUF2156 family)